MTRGSFCTLSMSPSAIDLSLVKHRDATRNGAHKSHIMFDHHYRVHSCQRNQKLSGALDLLRRHPGDGLVHGAVRILHQQHSDFEPLLLACASVPPSA